MTKRAIIAGAGLAGLSAAFHLRKSGIEPVVFEQNKYPGGLSASFKKNGFIFDHTGHYFHFNNSYAKDLAFGLLGGKFSEIKRKAAVSVSGELIDYPFQENFRQLKDTAAAADCEKGLKERKPRENYGSFKEWILGEYGEGIAKRFMLPYNEKIWQYDLDAMLYLGTTAYTPALKNGAKKGGYNASFYYPSEGGAGEVAKALAALAGEIRCGNRICSINASARSVTVNDNIVFEYGRLISTMPLPELIAMIPAAPAAVRKAAASLRYTSVFALSLGIKRKGITDRHWIYFPDKFLPFYRVGFYSNAAKHLAPEGTTSLYAETAYPGGTLIDKEALTGRIKEGLIKAGLLEPGDIILAEFPLEIPYAYVVYDLEYKKNTGLIFDYLCSQGIISTGRYGGWAYSAMEDALIDGKNAAEDILDA